MKTKCIIVDDEPIAIKVIKNHLQHFNDIEILAECKNAIQAFEVLKDKKIDLMFLDIHMPQISGMDFLRTLKNPPKVIITTAYRNYAVESYELEVLDYLIKPISLDRFMKAMDKYYETNDQSKIKIESKSQMAEDLFIYVKENKKVVKVFLKEITFIESLREYIRIHTENKDIVTKSPIIHFEENLPNENFIRVHKSFIIAISKISSFDTTSIWINKTEIPIGRSYKKAVLKALNFNKNLL